MSETVRGYTVLEQEGNRLVSYPSADAVVVENGYLFVREVDRVLAVYPTHTWVHVKRTDTLAKESDGDATAAGG